MKRRKRPKPKRERAIRQNLAAFPSSATAWKLAAELEGVSLSAWVRSHLDPVAQKTLRRARGDGRLGSECQTLEELRQRTRAAPVPAPSRALDFLLSGER